ncbi:MAG: excinuclease ABC subunit UvrB [Planctomycetota bacterium]|nr:excinuclease ABC subunit UvrB [Planctomycetota bacterium]
MKKNRFKLHSPFEPSGDQPTAIKTLVDHIESGSPSTTLLGVTGSGKTFTLANVIEKVQRPTLVFAHNKTLAAQLFQEFKEFFPENAVEYFVSYYDYYQPEAYLPGKDLYIEKDARMDQRLDKLRHRATYSLLTRSDVIIVATVSCIYGLGSPESYHDMSLALEVGQEIDRNDLLRELAAIQYARNDIDFSRGTFRARGDVLDVIPAHEDARAIRIEFFGDEIERLSEIDPLTGELLGEIGEVTIYPKSHYVTPEDALEKARETISEELANRLIEFRAKRKLLEAQRLEERTNYDLELLREAGICPGIENYTRHINRSAPGDAPATLMNYFPEGSLLFIDESHQSVPQVGAMYKGDRSRKETLVNYGFRLPSAMDNRPLKFEEWECFSTFQKVFVSATPRNYERVQCEGRVAEQIVRPTGLIDPLIDIRPTKNQVYDLKEEIEKAIEKGERVLVTTLTKRMSEDLAEFYLDQGMKVKYLHSDIETIERAEIIKGLRAGDFDCLIGINLLREGLDMPEVALVAILDADKEGFLRNETSLIQTCGRAARNINGRVIFYADKETKSIKAAVTETMRRREIQQQYNEEHGITPMGIKRGIEDGLSKIVEDDFIDPELLAKREKNRRSVESNLEGRIEELKADMLVAAEQLEFEKAAEIRDQIFELERMALEF